MAVAAATSVETLSIDCFLTTENKRDF